jgi:hypothetical protein
MVIVMIEQKMAEIFAYDPLTGVLTRTFKSGITHTVGTTPSAQGYLSLNFSKKTFQAHRVAWLLYYGEWPTGFIDHINGDGSDNRICNLRTVTNQENLRNQSLRSSNKSGVMGVCLNRRGTWRVEIGVNGRHRNLGTFSVFEDAVRARRAAEVDLGFHPNHGRQKSATSI